MFGWDELPTWAMALAIFVFRVCDVSMGTLRTLSIVNGRVPIAMLLGFSEALLWIVAISQIMSRVGSEPLLAVAYAAGFASGNAVGIWLERRLALGHVVLRMFSTHAGPAIAREVRDAGYALTTFSGEGRDGQVTLLYAACSRQDAARIIALALQRDPSVFYVVERSSAGIHAQQASSPRRLFSARTRQP